MEASGELHTLTALLPGKKASTHWRGHVGPRDGVDVLEKKISCSGLIQTPIHAARSLVTIPIEQSWLPIRYHSMTKTLLHGVYSILEKLYNPYSSYGAVNSEP